VAVDDVSNLILWTRLFLDEQGYRVSRNVVHQDNKSAILLETNGKRSSSKRTQAITIRYFFIADQVEKGNIEIKYCPTKHDDWRFFHKTIARQDICVLKRFDTWLKECFDNGNCRQECVRGKEL
jgi:hypothetical protein